MLRALLLAPPGAGKGTQGERLAAHYGVPHIATGDLLRRHVAAGTPLGTEAKAYVDRGELVPDALVIGLVADALSTPDHGAGAGPTPLEGFVLDGFPRTLDQAKAAHEWGVANNRTFHAVLSLRVAVDELVTRLLERGRRQGRTDDTDDTIRRRLQVYDEATRPLLDYYRGRGILHEADGTGAVEDVTTRLVDVLDASVSER